MRRSNACLRWALAGALCLAGSQVQAQDAEEGPDADEFVPGVVSFGGLTGLMTIPTAETLPQGKFAFGAFYDTEIEKDSRDPNDRDIHMVSLSGAVGLHDRLEVGVQVPWVWFERDTLNPNPGEDLNIQELGDITLQGKWALFRRGAFIGSESSGETEFPFGLSLTGGVRFGTGDEDARNGKPALGIGESTGEDTGLVGLLVDLPVPLGGSDRSLFPGPLLFTAGVGTEIPFTNRSARGEELETIVTYQAGVEIPVYGGYYLPGEKLSLETSLIGATNRLDAISGDDPLSLFGGLRYEVGNGFGLGAGIRAALVSDIDDYRGLVTLAYSGPVPKPQPEVVEVIVEKEVAAVAPVPAAIVKERLILPDVNFAFDKATLTPLGKGKVYLLANLINERRVKSIVIEGHTDDRGPAEYNMGLAQRRAEAIKTELVRLGVPASWLSVQSFGESRPLIPQSGEWAWSVNRRVEVLITPEDGETLRGMPAAAE